MAIVIGANYGYCVLAAMSMCIQCFYEGTKVTVARNKYKVQYPDNGGGRYSDKLKDEDWVKFNSIKRASDNYSEQLSMILGALLTAGAYQPKAAATLGFTYVLGRFLYSIGYAVKGPKGRLWGAPVMMLSFAGMVGVAMYNAAMTTIFA